jgi:hypothetical protein
MDGLLHAITVGDPCTAFAPIRIALQLSMIIVLASALRHVLYSALLVRGSPAVTPRLEYACK